MEHEFAEDWEFFDQSNSSLAYAKDSYFPKPYDDPPIIKPILQPSQAEEVLSTSHSEFEVEKIIKPKPQGNILDCPNCGAAIKPFQYKEEMAIFMCSSTECNFPFDQENSSIYLSDIKNLRHNYKMLRQTLMKDRNRK